MAGKVALWLIGLGILGPVLWGSTGFLLLTIPAALAFALLMVVAS